MRRYVSRMRDRGPVQADDAISIARRAGYVLHGEFGLRVAYDPEIVADRVVASISYGSYERFEGRRAMDLIESGDRITELGAGLGVVSALILSRKNVDDYQLVEADPRLPKLIRRTHDLNDVGKGIAIHSCVATCNRTLIERGEAEFFVDKRLSASSLLGTKDLRERIVVPVVSLPDLIAAHGSTVLISDVEGAEVDLFDGTELPSVDKILMEIHPGRIGQKGVRSIFRNLDAIGFVFQPQTSSGIVCSFRRYVET